MIPSNLHKKVKEFVSLKKAGTGRLYDKTGNMVIVPEKQLDVWRQYIEDLFSDTRCCIPDARNCINGPEITSDEIIKALKDTKESKPQALA